MPSSGPRSPANAAQGGTGVAWTNAGNIIASNNSYASVALNSSNNTSQRIYGYGYGFALPDGATVDGILAEYELKSDSAFRTDLIEAYVFDRATSTTVPVATKTNTTTLGTSDAYISRGGSADNWGLTGSHLDAAFINSADFGVGVRLALTSTLSQTPTLDHIRVTVWYTETGAPEITSGPTVSYGSLTRTGPNNGAMVTFTAIDAQQTGADELSWEIRTATGGGGTLVASGTATSGVSKQAPIAYDDPGIGEGSNTLYLTVSDGAEEDEESFTLLRDSVAPLTFTPVSDPDPVDGVREYAVTLTTEDATSTATNELRYQVRTAASGAGTLLTSGTRTSSGTAFTTVTFSDGALEEGTNTRYVRVIDGAGNVREEPLTVTAQNLPENVETERSASRQSPLSRDLFQVHIYPPFGVEPRNRLDTIDINPQVTQLSWRSVIPGGWSDASIGIGETLHRHGIAPGRGPLKAALRWQHFAHIEIRRGPELVFEGRLYEVSRPGGEVSGLTVYGYGLAMTRDMYYRNTSTTSTTSGTILRSMLAAVAPYLSPAPGNGWNDPGVAHQYDEWHLMHIADALDQIVSEGNDAGRLMDWWVYADRLVYLQSRREPPEPHYVVGWQSVIDWRENTSRMIGTVTHERVASGTVTPSTTDATNSAFSDTYGFQRGEALKLGEVTSIAALSIRRTYLERHSRPVVSAALEFGPGDMLTGTAGRVRPKWAARAGEWVQVGNEGMQMIVQTDYDVTGDVLRLEVGEFVPAIDTLIAALQKERLQRQRQINPFGGRAR